MLFFVTYQGKEHRIRVESRRHTLYVSFDGSAEEPVDLHFFGNECSFLHGNIVFSANIVGDKNDYTAWRPRGNLHFIVESEYKRIVGMLRKQELGQQNNVYAKMPGKVVKILTKEGAIVDKGDSLLVMEAMKMENEIRAGVGGTVTRVCIKEGQAVETGTLLVELRA